MKSELIYLDYNATTPVETDVLEKMIPYFVSEYGNPSNKTHRFGWAADEAATIAREQLATLIGGAADEIVFTAGATEAVNQAVKGVARTHSSKGKHIVTCATEHSAVLEACRSLQTEGFEITVLPVDESGLLSAGAVREALRTDTILVAVMWANNETGVIHPIQEIAGVVEGHDALFLTDATQAIGKVSVDVEGIDLLTCSAHKFYGPKGIGALYIRGKRPPIRISPIIHGGGQEGGLRSGTLNVPGIVGLGAAAEIAGRKQKSDFERLSVLRDEFERNLRALVDGLVINGRPAPRLPQTSNVSFPRVNAGDMLSDIGILAASAGSACSSASAKPSHVLTAMGLDKGVIAGSVRFSLGRHTTAEELERAIQSIADYFEKRATAAETHTVQRRWKQS